MSSIDGSAAGFAGKACVEWDAPEIIFVDFARSLPFTMAHEIGHVLGLVYPQWGHTLGMPGFYQSSSTELNNLMASTASTSDTDRERKYLSVGQVVRMHLARESWLNRVSAADGTTLRGRFEGGLPVVTTCPCRETEASDDCPALNLDIVRPGVPQSPSGEISACDFTVDPPTITVTCPNSRTVTVQLPANNVGSAVWLSLTPNLLEVTTSTEDTKIGVLTGRAAGTGKLRIVVEGVVRDLTVIVNGPCS